MGRPRPAGSQPDVVSPPLCKPKTPVTTLARTQRIVRVAIAGLAVLSIAACSSGASNTPTTTAVSETASPSPSIAATATDIDTGHLEVAFSPPAGWEYIGPWLAKSDNYGWSGGTGGPPFGFATLDVGNIYAKGCKWRLVDPPPGPTVDDLVAAYADLPGFEGARDTTVDGFQGKLESTPFPITTRTIANRACSDYSKTTGSPVTSPTSWPSIPSRRTRFGSST